MRFWKGRGVMIRWRWDWEWRLTQFFLSFSFFFHVFSFLLCCFFSLIIFSGWVLIGDEIHLQWR